MRRDTAKRDRGEGLSTTEMTLVTGERYSIRGSLREVEAVIISASRGSIMEFAWLTEQRGEAIGVNPAAVVSLRVEDAG